MRGELIRDPATVADLSHRAAESYGAKTAQRMMGLKFRPDNRVPTLEEFTEGGPARRHARGQAHTRLVRDGGQLENLGPIRPLQVSRADRRVERLREAFEVLALPPG